MIRVLAVLSLLFGSASAGEKAGSSKSFVGPGNEIPADRPVWGHREGLRIGLAPTPAPHGLIRIYAPYLGQSYPRMVNFISVEPMVAGEKQRGQSELEASRERTREKGLSFHASENPDSHSRTDPLPGGLLDPHGKTLRLFIHTEPFANGAKPVIEVIFHRDQPHAVEFQTYAHPESAPLTECVLSATMGNYGLLRQLHLNNRIVTAEQLWPNPDTPLDPLGFLPWKTFSPDQLSRIPGNILQVKATSDALDPAATDYPDTVPKSWKYRGLAATHIWRTAEPASVAVNARPTYWETTAAIPGGPSIENFELRAPFKPGRSLFFAIEPLPETP